MGALNDCAEPDITRQPVFLMIVITILIYMLKALTMVQVDEGYKFLYTLSQTLTHTSTGVHTQRRGQAENHSHTPIQTHIDLNTHIQTLALGVRHSKEREKKKKGTQRPDHGSYAMLATKNKIHSRKTCMRCTFVASRQRRCSRCTRGTFVA
jgi:hypothetical protein